MRQQHCSHEEAVAKAARTGQPPDGWPEGLAAHAAECAVCREVAQTARWMLALASESAEPEMSALNKPELVWWRARLAQEDAKTGKIRSVLEWTQIASAAAAPVGLASWVAWNWYAIAAAAEQFLLGAWPQLAGAGYALASLAPVALTLAALALVYPLGAID